MPIWSLVRTASRMWTRFCIAGAGVYVVVNPYSESYVD